MGLRNKTAARVQHAMDACCRTGRVLTERGLQSAVLTGRAARALDHITFQLAIHALQMLLMICMYR
jgi:hypothetical protein